MSKRLPGIQGVLGTYLTPTDEPARSSLTTEPIEKPIADKQPRKPKKLKRSVARLGRPPGKSATKATPKEKATLRIDAALMSEYRDWSWDQRCQLGELVERALAEYRRRHRK